MVEINAKELNKNQVSYLNVLLIPCLICSLLSEIYDCSGARRAEEAA